MSFVTRQERTPEDLSELLAILQAQGIGQPSMGALVGEYLSLPGLVGFWPGSAMGASGQLLDLSGNGLHLTNNNNVRFSADGIVPRLGFNGTSHYFSLASTSILNIGGNEAYVTDLSGMTLGAWVYFDTTAVATEAIVYKLNSTDRNYFIQRRDTGVVRFGIYNSNIAYEIDSAKILPAGLWGFIAGRFKPSAAIKVWVNDTTSENTISIPATIDKDAANFTIGASGVPGSYIDGRIALAFLCAAAVPDSKIMTLYHMGRRLFGA